MHFKCTSAEHLRAALLCGVHCNPRSTSPFLLCIEELQMHTVHSMQWSLCGGTTQLKRKSFGANQLENSVWLTMTPSWRHKGTKDETFHFGKKMERRWKASMKGKRFRVVVLDYGVLSICTVKRSCGTEMGFCNTLENISVHTCSRFERRMPQNSIKMLS